jgi:hypothetical protein
MKKPPPLPPLPIQRQASIPPTAEFHSLEAKRLKEDIEEVDVRISRWVLGTIHVVEELRITRWYVMALLVLHIILIVLIGLRFGK